MKVRSLLVALLLLSSTVQAGEQSTTDRVVEQATNLFESTIRTLASPFPFLGQREIECMARNIFYESANEPVEGKVAVGMVTLNRTADPRFPSNVCDVVKQKTTLSVSKKVKVEKTTGFLGAREVQTETQKTQVTVCQFSWVCQGVKKPRADDPRWIESQEVALALARGEYDDYREKYADAKFFHATHVKPGWKLKRVAKTGNHIFYQ